MRSSLHSSGHQAKARRPIIAPVAYAVGMGTLAGALWAEPTLGAQKITPRLEAPTQDRIDPLPTTQSVLPNRAVEYVVIVGFRLRSVMSERRLDAINQGYRELVTKTECETEVCGYVVVFESDKWRATNVLSGSEAQLRERQQNMEREGTTLVIVHPTGARRIVPEINTSSITPPLRQSNDTRRSRRPRN